MHAPRGVVYNRGKTVGRADMRLTASVPLALRSLFGRERAKPCCSSHVAAGGLSRVAGSAVAATLALCCAASSATESVGDHCHAFAERYAERERSELDGESVGVRRRPPVGVWIANVFQPPRQRFRASYRCAFELVSEDVVEVSVVMYLTKTRAFAEHTQWPRLQIVPIAKVADSKRGIEGYAVFKYLRED